MSRGTLPIALVLASCGGGAASSTTTPTQEALDPRRFFPLEAGMVWSYEIETGPSEHTLGTVRVLSVDAAGAHVATNGGEAAIYVVDADGVRRVGETGYVLRRPLELGASFPTSGGRTATVESTDERVRTGMGELTGCLRVVAVGGELGNSITTVYCPDVGAASIVTSLSSDVTDETIRLEATLIGLVRESTGGGEGTSTSVEVEVSRPQSR